MQVYNIPIVILNEWICEDFNPILDINGNHVVAVDADYSQHAFNNELLKCEIIKYIPPVIEQP